ncbi:MAG: glycosyltransferase [Acidobacteria bacterium]|nr:glycosyltransferase [Acidobacteriota bacterium]
MNVLYVSPTCGPHDLRFLQALSDRKVDAHFLCLTPDEEGRDISVPVTRIGWTSDGVDVEQLRQIAEKIRPAVVHAGPVPGPAWLVARAGLRPLVSASWGSDLLREVQHNVQSHERARFAVEHTDVALADCAAVNSAFRELGMAPERIVTFPWGVDLQDFSLTAAPSISGPLTLFSGRRWEPLYGTAELVEAFALATQGGAALRLRLLGSGSEHDRVGELTARPHMRGKVQRMAEVPESEIGRQLGKSDVYVSASHCDGSSVTLLQAMASGLPVIASDIPGNREWVSHDHNGWLFPPGDVSELARLMVHASASRSQLRPMGLRSRSIAEERADWSRHVDSLLGAYRLAMTASGEATYPH